MGVEDKDFIMRQIKQLGEGLGEFLGKEDVDKILNFSEDAQKETQDSLAEKKLKRKQEQKTKTKPQ
ncbi:hypothetical protein JZO66_15790 [Enterococcus sp. DIV0242_7C1]|uniref:Uncharacterized protein n=1 Tax=Candidatus Enterococcus dunnyi TaxID=1834192 RepID=A0A200JEB3_9ENTE|nr:MULTISPECIES: hypothetical protein [unclassified Enterococcus]MBO0472021.1 hypothetical protein [Enterococcus sp. DIV0242_7C1]OUZ34907.1 hypothetical protein A5889_000382 [Enterococcus sp. 9D6_DIV0238]